MDKNLKAVTDKRIAATIEALRKNQIEADYYETKEDMLGAIEELLPQGAEICSGGSMTLVEAGVIDLLSSPKYKYYPRGSKDPVTGEEIDVLHKALTCPFFFTSTNAITEDGYLYNVDGTGNRVAALIFGPDKVIVVAGANKIVANLEAAKERMRSISVPANATGLNKNTPCVTQQTQL